jgi:cytidylate kinase
MSEIVVIAIDGPAGAGKSTTARAVAAKLGLSYLDTGALYRCVALTALERGQALDDGIALAAIARSLDVQFAPGGGNRVLLSGRDVSQQIRTQDVSDAASRVSALPTVREALVELQRRAVRPPGTVAEGRDMGTVIFPEARLKVFLDASVDERARRRARDLQGIGRPQPVERVRDQIAERDARDVSRPVAPLRAAENAVVVDTTELTFDEVVACIVAEARRRGIGK